MWTKTQRTKPHTTQTWPEQTTKQKRENHVGQVKYEVFSLLLLPANRRKTKINKRYTHTHTPRHDTSHTQDTPNHSPTHADPRPTQPTTPMFLPDGWTRYVALKETMKQGRETGIKGNDPSPDDTHSLKTRTRT
ncbi:hypothetical protein VTJ04DRAFT_3013 [Mycothermus thermophilus]|uniref:uncharacterized protein n=1 Tax=Humicola insolens TaxID=85995 RepID=UPI003743AE6C